jgi:hypothetical protein
MWISIRAGSNPGSLSVNPAFSARGRAGLLGLVTCERRLCDASIRPVITSGDTTAPPVMIAEKALIWS